MSHQRAHVVIPTDLVEEIDAVIGQRKRSQFLVLSAQKELARLKQARALSQYAGAWSGRRHEIDKAGGSARFVKKIRWESEKRIKKT